MGTHKLGRDCKAKSGPAGTGTARERAEQGRPRTFRHSGAGIFNPDRGGVPLAGGRNCQPPHNRRTEVAVQRLYGIAAKVHQNTKKLVGIGIDLQAGRHFVVEADGGMVDKAEHVGDVVHQAVERHKSTVGGASRARP